MDRNTHSRTRNGSPRQEGRRELLLRPPTCAWSSALIHTQAKRSSSSPAPANMRRVCRGPTLAECPPVSRSAATPWRCRTASFRATSSVLHHCRCSSGRVSQSGGGTRTQRTAMKGERRSNVPSALARAPQAARSCSQLHSGARAHTVGLDCSTAITRSLRKSSRQAPCHHHVVLRRRLRAKPPSRRPRPLLRRGSCPQAASSLRHHLLRRGISSNNKRSGTPTRRSAGA